MTMDHAEIIAIQALSYISGNEALFHRFILISGVDLADLRKLSETPYFLASVLDFLRGDESSCAMFACNLGVKQDELARASYLLSSQPMEG